MKKISFITVFALAIFMSLSSCVKRCQVCTRNASPEIRVCEKDYNTNAQYGAALDSYEATGYSCRNL
ncbi:MAG: hypothetical protein IPP77_09705 [Bacteroidetes bacterium]|nr:hypothetical protein [Bacteroidota bacterium]